MKKNNYALLFSTLGMVMGGVFANLSFSVIFLVSAFVYGIGASLLADKIIIKE